jgi:hypothetical protein
MLAMVSGSPEHISTLGKHNTFHMWITPSTGVKRFESNDNARASLIGLGKCIK